MLRQRTILFLAGSFLLVTLVLVGLRMKNRLGDRTSAGSARTFTVVHSQPEDSPLHQSLEAFGRSIEGLQPEVKVTISSRQSAGSDEKAVDRLLTGEFDLVVIPTSQLSHLYPPIEYIDLPFIFQSRDDANTQIDGKIGAAFRAGIEKKGVTCFEHFDSGFKHFLLDKVIRDPDDIRGLKIRTARSSIISEQMRLWGALPVQIDSHQTARAIADNAVEGSESSLPEIEQQKLNQQKKFLNISNHGYSAQLPCLKTAKYSALPDALRQVLMRELKNAINIQRNLSQQREKLFLERATSSGIRLERLTELERLKFARATFSLRKESILRWNREFSLNLREPLSLDDSVPAENVSSQNDLVVGINADLSLGAATAGKSILAGAQFAVSEINAKGGLLGRPLRIEALDHGGINLRGIANLQKLEKKSGLIGVIGGIHSNVVLSELDFIHEAEIPYLIPWAAAVDIVDNGRSPNFVFRLGARDEYVARFLVGEAIRSAKKIALLLENTVWGRSCLQAMEKELLSVGLKPVAVQWVDRGAGEVNLQASAIGASGAEVVLMVLNSPEGALAVKTFAERRTTIRILSHWGITSHNFFKDASDALKKISVEFFQPFSFARIPQARAKDILQFFEKTRGSVNLNQIQAPAGFAHAYDLVKILSEAVKKAGRIERQAIRSALEVLPEYRGLSKTFNPVFTPQRHEALDPSGYFLAKFDSEGIVVAVEKK